MNKRILFVVSEDWYFVSHRLNLAKYAISQGYEVALICNFSDNKELIKKEGIIIFDWKINRGTFNPIKILKSLIELNNSIKTFRPNLVHVVSIQLILYTGLLNLFKKIDNKIYFFTGLGFLYSSKSGLKKTIFPIINFLLKKILSDNDAHIVVQNFDDEKYFQNKKLDNTNIHVIKGSGVDTDTFKFSKEEIRSQIKILLPARMLWSKGINDFVNCSVEISKNYNNVKFILAGRLDYNNPDSINLETITKWHDDGLIEWIGDRKDIVSIYKNSSIICLPSEREGLPKVLLEAASCGRPLIAYDVPGCREVVKHNFTGLLVNKNIKDLKKAIIKLIENKELRNRLGANGRQFVLENFSEKKIFFETEQLWKLKI